MVKGNHWAWDEKSWQGRREVIDIEAIKHLHELDEDGSYGIIKQLVQMYSDALPNRLRALQDSVRKRDFRQVARDAHAFKSPSAHLGIRRVVSLLQQIEDGDYEVEELDGLVVQVASEANLAKSVLEKKQLFSN
jgi:HPt (histidine-containing phosphotransfer) domain-containing protein